MSKKVTKITRNGNVYEVRLLDNPIMEDDTVIVHKNEVEDLDIGSVWKFTRGVTSSFAYKPNTWGCAAWVRNKERYPDKCITSDSKQECIDFIIMRYEGWLEQEFNKAFKVL